MVFNNGAVIPGRRPSIPKKKSTPVVKQKIVRSTVSVDDVVITDPPYYVHTDVIKIEVNNNTNKELEDIKDEVSNACPYAAAETIIPESPVEEDTIMETIERSVEDDLEVEEDEEDQIDVEEKKASKWERKKNKKNKKKATVAYEQE